MIIIDRYRLSCYRVKKNIGSSCKISKKMSMMSKIFKIFISYMLRILCDIDTTIVMV